MGRKTILDVLQQRENDKLDIAAQQLATLNAERHQVSRQHQQLQHYHLDYQQLLHHESAGGIYRYRRDNYLAFLHTVDHALDAQAQTLATLDQQQQQCLDEWQSSRKKVQALQVLLNRREQRIQRHQARAQQKANDEFAQRRFQGTDQ